MPITFDEVSAEIERDPEQGTGGAGSAAAPAAPAPDPREQFERELRIHAERRMRLSDH
ncbi:hypothetical protein QTH87_04735 [Variovorax sp. J22P168]|uniref:hypothetical protein n=1 Tax=Variovorax jilinensis TaxID=3053513 RepID=UPI002578A5E3|nr:hypothetical protein [Variovorax sp. J22P168]MDM0011738.1 hypothetical protein [Variovorax sp. J22P168]